MHYILHIIKQLLIIPYLRICYRVALYRIRKEAKIHPINVYFFVSEIAKWKAQSLYDLMESNNRFKPIICVYPMVVETDLPLMQLDSILNEKLSFFINKKMKAINVWDIRNKCVDMAYFKSCGIIFYQQTWDVPPAPTPLQIALKYITFYIPYYLVNNYDKKLDLCMNLHRQVFRYIIPSEAIKDFYEKEVNKNKFAGKLVGLGHTCIDQFHTIVRTKMDYTVIYAPHFSFPCNSLKRPLYYSTFLDNGEFILDYAKKHREVKWIFKPHPRLKMELEVTGVWPKEKIIRYFEDWENIGSSCYNSDYQELFVNSDLMITDCGSFLTEYACTGNPIVRMVSPLLNLSPNPIIEELYSTYYCVNNNDELNTILDMCIVERLDPQRVNRNRAIEKVGLGNSSASERIITYISDLLQYKHG